MSRPSLTTRLAKLASCALLLAGCACGCVGRAPGRIADRSAQDQTADLVYIRPEILAFLATAQRDLRTEEVACLVGGQVGRTLVVDGMRPARMWGATDRTAHYSGCEGTLGTWHNHPEPESGGNYCAFSVPDTKSFLDSDAVIDLVSCGDGEFRLRTRARPDSLYVIRPESAK